MTPKEFFNRVANGKADILQTLLDALEKHNISYCVIGGLAVNAYVEPVISLDLDIVVTIEQLERLKSAVAPYFKIKEFPHSINLYSDNSDIRIQVQTDRRYQDFIPRATPKEVLGYRMPVAALEDVLQGKIWAYSDPERRASKRQKDLADIMRIIEAYPHLRSLLPEGLNI